MKEETHGIRLDRFIKKNMHNKKLHIFSIFAIVMIVISTYRLGTYASLSEYTFSMIGNKLGHRVPFIIWGVITGSMLLFFVLRLYILNSFKSKKARTLLFRATFLLVITVFIPSVDHLPVLKELHFITALAFAVCLMISLYLFTIQLQYISKKTYRRSMGILYFTIGGSLLMLLIFGKTGLFEIFFFFALTIFLIILKFWIPKNNIKKK